MQGITENKHTADEGQLPETTSTSTSGARQKCFCEVQKHFCLAPLVEVA